MEDNFRKTLIGDKIAAIINKNKDLPVAKLLVTALRSKGRPGVSTNALDLTDKNLLVSLESLEKELYDRDWTWKNEEEIIEE